MAVVTTLGSSQLQVVNDLWYTNEANQVLNSRLEKTRILNNKLSAALSRLEQSGKSVQEAVGPIYGNTQKLQVLGTSQ
jgi:hypothetical protein